MDMTRQDVCLSSLLDQNFLRSINENKLHSPCIQYVTAKVTHSAENAKHLARSGVVARIYDSMVQA